MRGKKGYGGVGIYCEREPDRVIEGCGIPEIDVEGRCLEAHFGSLSVVPFSLPSGSRSEQRLASKFRFLEPTVPHLYQRISNRHEVIIYGDWNIAHREIDLKNWRGNRRHPGFLPEQRAWLIGVFDHLGYVDVFRRVDPRAEQYTW